MNRRRIENRLECLEAGLGTGSAFLNVEFYREAEDGTLVRLPRSRDNGADRTIRVVFVRPRRDGDCGREPR
jgi:hypothetical protein